MHSTILRWAYKYRIHDAAAFAVKTRNIFYSSEFKTRYVEEVLNGLNEKFRLQSKRMYL